MACGMARYNLYSSPPPILVFPPKTNINNNNNNNKWACRQRSLSYDDNEDEDDEGGDYLSFRVGTHLIPHPSKIDKGGEDAFLIHNQSSIYSNRRHHVLAVADGVSSWAKHNVDPALFSRGLMDNASSLLLRQPHANSDPHILLKNAHAATSATTIGSATAIVAMLQRNGLLKIANLGDCALRLIRQGSIIFSTSPQEHYFDCPYQLSSQEDVGQTFLDATVSHVQLIVGDTVIMGSDGLFDNLFDYEILSTLLAYKNVAQAAKALAASANNHSMDPHFESPYIMEARAKGYDVPMWKKLLGMKLTGGKPDDITVIVGQVMSSSDPNGNGNSQL